MPRILPVGRCLTRTRLALKACGLALALAVPAAALASAPQAPAALTPAQAAAVRQAAQAFAGVPCRSALAYKPVGVPAVLAGGAVTVLHREALKQVAASGGQVVKESVTARPARMQLVLRDKQGGRAYLGFLPDGAGYATLGCKL